MALVLFTDISPGMDIILFFSFRWGFIFGVYVVKLHSLWLMYPLQ